MISVSQRAVNRTIRHTTTIVGTFSKGTEFAYTINFGISGGSNCDLGCKHHPQSTDPDADFSCYAARNEIRPDRGGLHRKLSWLQTMPPAIVCGAALCELQRIKMLGGQIDWLRFSTNGSLPQLETIRADRLFRTQFRALCGWCKSNEIPVHCPVESYAKARLLRSIVGDLAIIRESAQSADRFVRATGQVSAVAGQLGDKLTERVQAARDLATKRREATGRKTIVCPAVLNSFAVKLRGKQYKNENAKCGFCTCCAEDVDVVYPLH